MIVCKGLETFLGSFVNLWESFESKLWVRKFCKRRKSVSEDAFDQWQIATFPNFKDLKLYQNW